MTRRRINLALQGGGAHGAFTWGVLDRMLEDEELEIAGISGTSAGALNGAALKAGLAAGGRDEARRSLDWLWKQVGAVGDLRMAAWMSALFPAAGIFKRLAGSAAPVSPAEMMTRMLSPYSYGPFYRNPLERVVNRFRYDRICAHEGPRLFISATNVRTGKIRVFSGEEITTDVILASACLPSVFQAVEFDDPRTGVREAFWDGGYTGNPALFPLFAGDLPADIIVVNINPLLREAVPTQPQDILNRINEISFNSSLLRELRAVAFVKELLAEKRLEEGVMKNILLHMIADDSLMTELNASTKLMPSPLLLFQLKQAGRRAADAFLTKHRCDLGQRDTMDLADLLG